MFQLHDDEFSNGALDALLKCILAPAACCAAADIVEPVVATCFKTQGVLGEIENPFSTDGSISAGYLTLGQTLVAYQAAP